MIEGSETLIIIILIIIVALVCVMGAIAFYQIKENERLKRQLNTPPPKFCPTCGELLRYIRQYRQWYCDKEEKYV
jgi:flagellar basal body-associated protein FliL